MNYEFDFIPQPGKVLLYVILTDVEGRTIAETLKLLKSMGYEPQLRYWQWGESTREIKLYAVLKDQEMPPNAVIGGYLVEEYNAVIKEIQPSSSVRLAWGSVPEQSSD